MEPLISGGYILLSRNLLESEIWSKPPLYLKIWVYLLSKAQHQNYRNLKRGQLVTSIPEIQEAMSHMVGFRKQKPSRKQVWSAIEWLRNSHLDDVHDFRVNGTVNKTRREPMIETTKATHGILVNIVNYGLYQEPKNYEGNNGRTNEQDTNGTRTEQQGNNINKNVKNDKNDKKETYTCVFEEFWKEYPRKIGKKNAFRNWNTRLKEKHDPGDMIFATKNYAKYCKQNNTETRYMKHPSTFIGPDKPFEDFLKPTEIEKPKNSWSHLPDYTGKGKRPDKEPETVKTKIEDTAIPSMPIDIDKLINDTANKLSQPKFNFEEAKAKMLRDAEEIRRRERLKTGGVDR